MTTPLSGFPQIVSLHRQSALPAPRAASISGHGVSISSPSLGSGLQTLALSNQVRFGMAWSQEGRVARAIGLLSDSQKPADAIQALQGIITPKQPLEQIPLLFQVLNAAQKKGVSPDTTKPLYDLLVSHIQQEAPNPEVLQAIATQLDDPQAIALKQLEEALLLKKLSPTVSVSAPNVESSEAEAAFKAICDTVVGTEGTKSLTVAHMIARLCHRKKEYPGRGTVDTLSEFFPGLNTTVLKQCFGKLHNRLEDPCYLGLDYMYQDELLIANPNGDFWLRPIGEKMIEKLYPGLDLPPKEERYTSAIKCHLPRLGLDLPPKGERYINCEQQLILFRPTSAG